MEPHGSESPQEDNVIKTMAAIAVSAALVAPALAQDTWYIVQDTSTKRCTVVKERPTTKTTVIVGPAGTVYKTETEARKAMKTVKVCETR
jgi:hypothetical protein